MTMMNGMIRAGRLTEFVDSFVDTYNEEQEEKAVWEIWLHRIFDKSYSEFKSSLSGNEKAAPTQEDIAGTVRDSKRILSGFVPDERVGGRDGAIQAAGHDSG